MSNYKHVLIATDLHNDDLPVVKKAVAMMKRNEAKLTIVTVVPHIPYYMASGLSSVTDIESRIEQDCRAKMERVKTQIDVEADYIISHGSATIEIVRLADKIQADIIVIGSHGHGGVKRLLGSTASSVLHHANCDVLVVRIRT
ncbi:MAG: universal stress protein [Gammaproteobacteria bacterium]|jgi:universal stress protein A|nr:universal stress protein [Gammaproteobacteria bacterium]